MKKNFEEKLGNIGFENACHGCFVYVGEDPKVIKKIIALFRQIIEEAKPVGIDYGTIIQESEGAVEIDKRDQYYEKGYNQALEDYHKSLLEKVG